MKKEGIVQKVERFETHHRIAVFCVIIVAAILATRVFVFFRDPNPVLFGIELHHFDYGIFLLLITSQLSLFGSLRYRNLYIVLTAVASALILDEYWVIRNAGVHNYTATLFPVMVLAMAVLLVTLFLVSLLKKRR